MSPRGGQLLYARDGKESIRRRIFALLASSSLRNHGNPTSMATAPIEAVPLLKTDFDRHQLRQSA